MLLFFLLISLLGSTLAVETFLQCGLVDADRRLSLFDRKLKCEQRVRSRCTANSEDCHDMLGEAMRRARLRILYVTRSSVPIQSRPDRIDYFRNAPERAFASAAF